MILHEGTIELVSTASEQFAAAVGADVLRRAVEVGPQVVPSAAAAANAFELPPYGGGIYAAALAYGPPRGNVTVHLRLPGSPPPSAVTARATLLDGATANCAVSAANDGTIGVAVPVTDGCAVVRLYVGE